MRTTLIVGIFLGVAVAVLSRRPEPVLKPYPTVFTAVYNNSDRAAGYEKPTMYSVSLDLPNKRASISWASQNGQTESWIYVFKPQGADPQSPAGQGYVGFNLNSNSVVNPPNGCFYTTTNTMGLAPFPDRWMDDQHSNYPAKVNTWFNIPNDMVYAGQYYIEELGVMSYRWDSISQCVLEKTGIGQVPCTSVMYSQGPNSVPLMDIRAFGARKNSFQNDRYAIRVYHSFTPNVVTESAFALPNNWPVTCGNADNQFLTTPDYGFYVYDNGQSSDDLTIKLSTPPIVALGDVKVYLASTPTNYFNCADCIAMGVNYLTFNHQNWNVSQIWPAKYRHNGCSMFTVKATGGGYDWTFYQNRIGIYACEGSKDKRCTTQARCGN